MSPLNSGLKAGSSLTRRDFLGIGGSAVALAAGFTMPAPLRHRLAQARFVTVPMDVIHATPVIPVTLQGPGGVERTVKCWLDTGGGAVILERSVAAALSLQTRGDPGQEGLQEIDPPQVFRIGDMALDLTGVMTAATDRAFFSRTGAECFLPSRILARYHVVFDYPGGTFTLADAGSVQPRGIAVSTPVSEQMRFVRIPITVDGEEHGMLLDTGASHTMMSAALIDRWSKRHPNWPSIDAAVGTANMGNKQADDDQRMFCVGGSGIGGIEFGRMSVVSRGEGTFEEYMSGMMSAPIVGALAGNVLRRFRVEIDYSAGITYLSDAARDDERDLTIVPLTLDAAPDGRFLVLDAADPRLAAHIGDRLLSVDGTAMTGLPFARAVDLLRGPEGAKRVLRLEHDGATETVEAAVVRFC